MIDGSDPQLAAILADLDAHSGLFDLSSEGLGDDALAVASADVAATFDAETAPDGAPWPELSGDYSRWKQAHWPGRPILVRSGELRQGLAGEGEVTPGSAELPIGASPELADLAAWMNDGDAVHNRPPRELGGLSPRGVAASDELFDRHFEKGTR